MSDLVIWTTRSPRFTRVGINVTANDVCRILVLEGQSRLIGLEEISAGTVMSIVRTHVEKHGMDMCRRFDELADHDGWDADRWTRARSAMLRHWPALASEIPEELS
jgi:hypothetical protein